MCRGLPGFFNWCLMLLPDTQKILDRARLFALTVPFIILGLSFLVLMYHFSPSRILALDIPVFMWPIIAVIFIVTLVTAWAHYSDKCSKLLMPSVLDSISHRLGSDFKYDHDGRNKYAPYDLEESGLVDLCDEHNIGSRIDSTMPNGNPITLFNFKSYRVTRDKDGKKQRHVVEDGVFVDLRVEMDSDVKIIVRDKQFFSSKTMRIHSVLLNKLRSVNAQFDKDYQVYTNDDIRAMRFLSPSMVEKFMRLAREHGHVSEISVSNGRIFMFLNGASIKAVSWLPIKRPDIDEMIAEARDNLDQILDMMELIYNEERLGRMNT